MKGHTNNPNGRPKGTPNRITKELRAILKDVIAEEIEKIPEHMTTLEPRERIELLSKLLPYAMPKVAPAPFHVGEPDDFDILSELGLG